MNRRNDIYGKKTCHANYAYLEMK